jgi:aminopeptidase YwaD
MKRNFIAYYLALENRIPTAYCNVEHETFLFKSLGNKCRFYWHSIDCKKTLKNLVAEIKRTTFPNEIIIIGAHIDSFPGTVGASDNACGSAILVEFIKYFVKYPPARTIRFVWFTGEELGLRGSYSYMKSHLHEKDIFRLYVNVDTGFSMEHGVPYVTVTGKKDLTTNVKSLTAKLAQNIPVHESNSTSGDAIPFNEHGISTVFVCARNMKPYPHPHLPTDTFDKLDIKKIQLIGNLSLNIIDTAQRRKLF